MSTRCIGVRSVTYAQKARQALSLRGIRARLTKAEAPDDGGCVYGIDVREGDFPAAVQELHRLGIDYRFSPYDIPR
jgi:hypothetical protein